MAEGPVARIQELNLEVERLFATGARQSALQRSLEVVEEAQAVLDPADLNLGASINNAATIYDSLGDFASARPLYERVIDILDQAPEDARPHLATVLTNLALGWWAAGDLATAVGLAERAREVRRAAFGDDSPEEERSRQNLAALYGSIGDFERAEQFLSPSLVVAVLDRYGHRFESEGKYELAHTLYEQASVAVQRIFGPDHSLVAGALNNVGLVTERLGRYPEADSSYRRALEILGESDDDLLGTTLNNLGWLRYSTGDYRSAEDFLERALDIRRRALGKDHPDVAQTLNNLAALRLATRDMGAAEALLKEALDIQEGTGPAGLAGLADTLNNLGVVLRAGGRLDDAAAAYQRALEVRVELQGAQSGAVGETLNNLGAILYSAGQYEEAYEAFNGAYQIREAALGETHPDVGQSLMNAASALQALGNHQDALAIASAAQWQLQESLGSLHPNVALALIVQAESLAANGQTDSALSSVLEAAAVQDAVVDQVFAIASESERLMVAERLRGTMEAALWLVLQDQSPSDVVDQVFDLVLRRKGLVTEFAASQRAAILEGRYPDLMPTLRELFSLRRGIAEATLVGPGPEDGEAHDQRLDALDEQREDLERRLANRIPEMALEQQIGAVGPKEVRAAIPKGMALVEFVRFEPYRLGADRVSGEAPWLPARYIAFVLLPRRKPQLVDLGEADPIDKAVATFRASVTGETESSGSPASDSADGAALRSAVFDPILSIVGKRTRILIAPDGDLSRLPFEVLPTDRGRLMDHYDITYITSARDIARFGAKRVSEATPPLVVADPDFDLRGAAAQPALDLEFRQSPDLRGHPRFPPLPATRSEGERIAQSLGVVPALGAKAVDPMVRAARSPRVLHLATHGFFLPDQPRDRSADLTLTTDGGSRFSRLAASEDPLLRSGLALAGVNAWLAEEALDPNIEDGVLTAEDVAGMDLLGTELVVLSACETGLGSVKVGEGVFGLRRAFVVAGARSLVMSLWKVPDQATAELMQDFYGRMADGEPPAMAFRASRLSLMDRYPNPLYWGAFIYQGDPGSPRGAAG